MRITKRQLRRIIKEEFSRVSRVSRRRRLSENAGEAYDLLHAKYDAVSDRHSRTDGSNALMSDLDKAGLWEDVPDYEQDLGWVEQLKWVKKNLSGKMAALLQAATDNPKYGYLPGGVNEDDEDDEDKKAKGGWDYERYGDPGPRPSPVDYPSGWSWPPSSPKYMGVRRHSWRLEQ